MLKILALFLASNLAHAQTCETAKTNLDSAVAAVKLSCFDKTSAPAPTPKPAPTPVTETWTKCADEGATCTFTGTRQVRYGITAKFVTKTATGSIGCNNTMFTDPAVGIAKTCAFSSIVTSAPAPTPTPVIVSPAPVPPVTSGAGIFIGQKEFGSLADAGAAVTDGQTILITKDLDNQATALTSVANVSVECVKGVKLTWSGGLDLRLAWGKGIFNVEGATKNFSMKNCEISGAKLNTSNGANGAAVRLIDGLDSATFDSVYFHNNNNGILGGAKTVTIKNSKFEYNGEGPNQDGRTHNIYISAFTDQLTVTDSYFGPDYIGNIFKSRAKATTVTRCTFESKDSVDSSYLLDLPNGGKAVVSYSVFVKAPNQGQRSIFSYGVEGLPSDGRVNEYESHHNTVVNDGSANFMNGTGSFNFHDNTLIGPGMSGTIAQTAEKDFATRAEAKLAPAPALPQIPSMGIMGFIKNLF